MNAKKGLNKAIDKYFRVVSDFDVQASLAYVTTVEKEARAILIDNIVRWASMAIREGLDGDYND